MCPGTLDTLETVAENIHPVAGVEGDIQAVDGRIVGPVYRGLVRLAQCLQSTDVVEMMMGNEDASQLQLAFTQGLQYRCGVARVDHEGRVAGPCDQPDVVVVVSGNGFDSQHGILFHLAENAVTWRFIH